MWIKKKDYEIIFKKLEEMEKKIEELKGNSMLPGYYGSVGRRGTSLKNAFYAILEYLEIDLHIEPAFTSQFERVIIKPKTKDKIGVNE